MRVAAACNSHCCVGAIALRSLAWKCARHFHTLMQMQHGERCAVILLTPMHPRI